MSVKNLEKSDRPSNFNSNTVNTTKDALLAFCNEHEKIYLYGAGDFGAGYAAILKYEGIKIAGFIVTKKSDNETYCDLPIYELQNILPKLTEKDGVIFSVGVIPYEEIKFNIPSKIPTIFFKDLKYLSLQNEFYNKVLEKNIKEIIDYTQIGKRLQTETCLVTKEIFRRFSLLCNKEPEDPDLIFYYQAVFLKQRNNKNIPFFLVDDTAIVMQGPICKRNNFTLRTALFYRKLYPNIPIIISTWENEMSKEFQIICSQNNIITLENQLPSNSGAQHINYQMFSSLCGVRYIKTHTKAKYVIKTRTDRRINRKDFLIYLKNLLKLYSPIDNKLKARICFLEHNLSRPFFILDFESFGTIEDIEKLYSSKINNSLDKDFYKAFSKIESFFHKAINFYKTDPTQDISKFLQNIHTKRMGSYYLKRVVPYSAEVFIHSSFYDRYIEPLNGDRLYEQYLNFLKNYTIMTGDLLIYWEKYEEQRGASAAYFPDIAYEDWLHLYMNVEW